MGNGVFLQRNITLGEVFQRGGKERGKKGKQKRELGRKREKRGSKRGKRVRKREDIGKIGKKKAKKVKRRVFILIFPPLLPFSCSMCYLEWGMGNFFKRK